MNKFILTGDSLIYKNFIFKMYPIIDSSNSSYWIFNVLASLSQRIPIKIRINPFLCFDRNNYNPTALKMILYCKALDWDRIKSLKNIEEGAWIPDFPSLVSNSRTEFVWSPTSSEVSFTCEELPNPDKLLQRGSRYFHAIFDKKTGMIKHCDGAVRIYSKDEYQLRSCFHIKNSEVRKIGKRIKFFQIDSNIEQKDFINLAVNFFVWNQDIIDYFNK